VVYFSHFESIKMINICLITATELIKYLNLLYSYDLNPMRNTHIWHVQNLVQ